MKKFFFDVDDLIFQKVYKRIESKKDIMIIWMELIKYINIKEFKKKGDIVIVQENDLKRIFIKKQAQILSLHFPFHVKIYENRLKVFFERKLLDNGLTSKILEVLYDDINQDESLEDFFSGNNNDELKSLIKELMLLEDGYIRYDYDVKNFDENNPLNHPLNHFDIFYTDSATFKLGVENKLDLDFFINVLNKNEKSYFVIDKRRDSEFKRVFRKQ